MIGFIILILFVISLGAFLYMIHIQIELKEVCKGMELFDFYKMKKLEHQKAIAEIVAATSFSIFLLVALLQGL